MNTLLLVKFGVYDADRVASDDVVDQAKVRKTRVGFLDNVAVFRMIYPKRVLSIIMVEYKCFTLKTIS